MAAAGVNQGKIGKSSTNIEAKLVAHNNLLDAPCLGKFWNVVTKRASPAKNKLNLWFQQTGETRLKRDKPGLKEFNAKAQWPERAKS